MRISDWSSDVCSSEAVDDVVDVDGQLVAAQVGQHDDAIGADAVGDDRHRHRQRDEEEAPPPRAEEQIGGEHAERHAEQQVEIGRASWRERGWQSVEISGVAVSLKKKKNSKKK